MTTSHLEDASGTNSRNVVYAKYTPHGVHCLANLYYIIMIPLISNLLKPSSYFTYHQVEHSKILHANYIAFVCFI
jgi:hypothetical protein